VAAHAAAREHLKVVVWERSKSAGGSTALSSGLVPAAGTRMQRAAGIFEAGEDFVRDVFQRNGSRSDPALTRRLCESSAALVEWLVDTRSIPLELVTHVCDPGHSRPRLHAPPSRTGQAIIDGLVRTLERRGIRLRLGTPVLQLWTAADGAVLGVQVKTPKKTATNVRCGKLVLATDGFGASRELVAQHCPLGAGQPYVGAPTSTGDALAWAADVGAATLHLGAYEAHATIAVGSNLLIPWNLVTQGALLVNQRGERFADEARGPSTLVAALRAQPGRVAYEVFDARIHHLAMADDPHFASTVMPRAVRRADDLPGLAKQFQIDAPALARTVAAHAGPAPPSPPFYGIRVGAALLQTQGGLAIDPSARVLHPDGTVIPNLYAGGGTAVGISGPDGDGYLLGNGLLCALGWGKIAGEQAAFEIAASRATQAASEAEPLDN
jgi:fumarate reductase flavoprotein subunit